MKRIYLMRHAEPELGGRHHVCLGGRSDVPLSGEGLLRARAAAGAFDSEKNYRVYASPMLRARQTAEAVADGRWRVELLPGMEEIDCGEWDGLDFDEIRRLYPELYARRGGDLSLTPPGGESLEAVARRGMAALESLLAGGGEEDIILVAHKGINRVLLCAIMGESLSRYRSIEQDYACVNIIAAEKGRMRVEAIGLEPGSLRKE